MFSSFVALFEQHTGPALAAMEDALQAQDLEAIGHVAHRVRGGAATLGALRLAEHCRVIERMSSLEVPKLQQELQAVRRAYDLFLVESRAFLASLAAESAARQHFLEPGDRAGACKHSK